MMVQNEDRDWFATKCQTMLTNKRKIASISVVVLIILYTLFFTLTEDAQVDVLTKDEDTQQADATMSDQNYARTANVNYEMDISAEDTENQNVYKDTSETSAQSMAKFLREAFEESSQNSNAHAVVNDVAIGINQDNSFLLESGTQLAERIPFEELKSTKRLFFNRVPKCGSSTVQALINAMTASHKFHYKVHINYTNGEKHLQYDEQESLVDDFMDLRTPLIYNQHVHYINFTRFGYKQPHYINVIRDPFERFMSSFHYRIRRIETIEIGRLSKFNAPDKEEQIAKYQQRIRNLNTTFDDCVLEGLTLCKNVKDYFILIPYLCGQDPICLQPSPDSLALAKHNIVHNYALVGITDDMLTFAEGLEQLFPQFFSGAKDWYEKTNPRENAYQGKKSYNQTTVEHMRYKLKEEYDLYNFAKQVFYQKVSMWRNKLNTVT